MKVGFIGCGNMAKAMIHGMLGSKKVQPQEMIASAKSEKTREAISSQIGIRAAKTNTEVLEFADIVFLAVKPQYLEAVLTEIRGAVRPFQVFVSLAPGKTLDWLSQRLGYGRCRTHRRW